MFDIDKKINNILGKNKKKKSTKFTGLSMSKVLGKNSLSGMMKGITHKPIKNIMKGASLGMQNQWKGFGSSQKRQKRILHKDTDKDGVPNRWDCQPMNPRMQDTKKIFYEWPPIYKIDIYDKENKKEMEYFLDLKDSIIIKFKGIGPGLLLFSKYSDNESGVSSENGYSPRGVFTFNGKDYNGWLCIYGDDKKTEIVINKNDLNAFKNMFNSIFGQYSKPPTDKQFYDLIIGNKGGFSEVGIGDISYLDYVVKLGKKYD